MGEVGSWDAISRVSSSEYASATPTTAVAVDLPPWTRAALASSMHHRVPFASVSSLFIFSFSAIEASGREAAASRGSRGGDEVIRGFSRSDLTFRRSDSYGITGRHGLCFHFHLLPLPPPDYHPPALFGENWNGAWGDGGEG